MKPKIIEIDNILRGCNSLSKVNEIYNELRLKVFEEPIQKSQTNLVIVNEIDCSREGSYSWELYKSEFYEVFLEKFGNWKGYARDSIESQRLLKINITLYKDKRGIKKSIEKILETFPRN
jgi:hypothetical protein